MRGKIRQKQKIYIVVATKVPIYDKHGDWTGEYKEGFAIDKELDASISETAGLPSESGAGIVLDYDRYFMLYHNEVLEEGTKLYVDREITKDEHDVITNTPDYIITKQLTTQRGHCFRWGIKKIV